MNDTGNLSDLQIKSEITVEKFGRIHFSSALKGHNSFMFCSAIVNQLSGKFNINLDFDYLF